MARYTKENGVAYFSRLNDLLSLKQQCCGTAGKSWKCHQIAYWPHPGIVDQQIVTLSLFMVFVCSLSLLSVLCFEAEEVDDRKVQIVPPGFHVIFLPFADDFRKLKLDEQLPRGKLLAVIPL